ncbi:MAG: hypothetical protein ACP5NV_06860 [Candidatus Woesearchaeota archaeon]
MSEIKESSKTRKKTPEFQGIRGLHLALRLNENYFPPSQFALAWIASKEPLELDELIKQEAQDAVKIMLKNENYTTSTPLFYDLVRNTLVEENGVITSTLDLKYFSELAKKYWGMDKQIMKNPILDVSRKYQGSVSPFENFNFKIDTLGRRTSRKPAHNIVIGGLYIRQNSDKYSLEDMANMHISSSTKHFMENTTKSRFFNQNNALEKKFLNDILLGKFDDKISKEELTKAINSHSYIADFGLALAMTFAHDEWKNKRSRIKNLNANSPEPFMPYSFDEEDSKNKRVYLLEAFLMAYKKTRSKNKESTLGARLYSIDSYLFEKFSPKGIFTKMAAQAILSGNAEIQALKLRKSFNTISMAITIAATEYFISKGRVINGFSEEFRGTEYQTIAIDFKPEKSEKFRVMIIYDNNLKLPYLYYKNFDNGAKAPISDISRLNKNPLRMVNWAKGIRSDTNAPKFFYEKDLMNVKSTKSTIREPDNVKILNRAAELLTEQGYVRPDGKKFNSFYIKSLYISNSKCYTLQTISGKRQKV